MGQGRKLGPACPQLLASVAELVWVLRREADGAHCWASVSPLLPPEPRLLLEFSGKQGLRAALVSLGRSLSASLSGMGGMGLPLGPVGNFT